MRGYPGVSKAILFGTCAVLIAACGDKGPAPLKLYPDDAPKAEGPRIDPAAATERLGDAAYLREDYALAAQMYYRSFQAKPGENVIATKLGFALFKAGHHEDAQKVFSDVLERKPADGDAMRGMAHAMVAQGRPADAIPIYRKALEVRGGQRDPRLYGGLGAALDLTGKFAEARAAYLEGLKAAPKDPGLRNNLAMSLAIAGDYDQATALIEGMIRETGGGDQRLQRQLALIGAMRSEAAARPMSKPAAEAPARSEAPAAKKAARPMSRPVEETEDKPEYKVRETAALPGVVRERVAARADVDEPSRGATGGVIDFRTDPVRSAARETKDREPATEIASMMPAPAGENPERAAREVADLLSAAERGPRFVWQEAARLAPIVAETKESAE